MTQPRLRISFLLLVLHGLINAVGNQAIPQYGSPVGIGVAASAGASLTFPYSVGGYGIVGTPQTLPPPVQGGYGGSVSGNVYGIFGQAPGYSVPNTMPGYGLPATGVSGTIGGYGLPATPITGYGGPGIGGQAITYGGQVTGNAYGILGGQRNDVCGLPGTGGSTVMLPTTQFARMLGGTQVTNQQYCWTCAVFDRGTNTYIGGASIVDRQFLVSSASIFDGHVGNSIVVRCGIINAQSGPTQGPCGQFREVSMVRFAPNYKETDQYYRNNLAILKLSQPLDMSQPCVCKICLPGPTSNYVGQKCTATGYGVNKKGGSYPGALYAITVEVINEAECNAALKQVVAGFELHNSQLCAGGQQLDVDACSGDGGSPLACIDQTGLYVLAGVVSAGFQCGVIGVPGLYTNVKIFSPFIDTIVKAG